MEGKRYCFKCLFINALLLFVVFVAHAQSLDKTEQKTLKKLNKWNSPIHSFDHMGEVMLDSLWIDKENKEINLFFSASLSYWPWRTNLEERFRQSLKNELRGKVKTYDIHIFSGDREISELIPNVFRSKENVDQERMVSVVKKDVLIAKEGKLVYGKGLSANYIALWPSHGLYYESKLDRWEWQRTRLFGSVEDISPMLYVLPYIVPMLENAGATVFLPRERSFQKNELIVDEDASSEGSEFILSSEVLVSKEKGFALKDTLFPGENPFLLGSSVKLSKVKGKVATYLPDFPEKGTYETYISFQQSPNNAKQVKYKVNHTGGSTSFAVNQTMGGGTWIYLGAFEFNKGKNVEQGSVEVYCANENVSLDAIRFGGGMGNVARRAGNEMNDRQEKLKSGPAQNNMDVISSDGYSWKKSQRPRYMEGARYWLQYAGMPDTLVFSLNDEKKDYNDDYQSRGEWVDYLMGAPNGPQRDRNVTGLNIPIDLSLAFHTDAGITSNDSVIGTLGIYSSVRDDGKFPNGQSKLASRDLTDIIQSQIVGDVRALYNNEWTRRGMWDKEYSEAWRPNVPAMLLELLSHQNLADMKFGLDPRFRFDVSRAVYKGMLKFLAYQEGRPYVVQPLPVDHMAITKEGGEFVLSWKPVLDPLEESAVPTQYKVYRRIGENGFDNGTLVKGLSYKIPKTAYGQPISFKVTALNEGGEGMAGEILSMGIVDDNAPWVLVVNAFDRVAPPAFVDENNFAGVAWWQDQGVPNKFEYGYTGHQYDFNRQSPWLDDDSPGWGASYADMEGRIIPGNSFDFTLVHGKSVLHAGYSYISVSDEVFNQESYSLSSCDAIDVILGEEKTTPTYLDPNQDAFKIYTQAFMKKLTEATSGGLSVFMSGAYVGSDIHFTNDTVAEKFASEVLHFRWRSDHAVNKGNIYPVDNVASCFSSTLEFNTDYDEKYYTVEAPDALIPEGKGALTAFRYRQNNSGAGIIYEGHYKTVVMGFPFESIQSELERDALMKEILLFLKR
jgi:hypothetical protein